MFVLKLCGSASKAGYSFEKIMDLGYAVNANAVTVGSSLDHCHIPGREHHREIPDHVVVLGMGIHNEPGLHEISPIPEPEELVSDMLKYCLDSSDKDRAFVDFKPEDVVLLLINNFGGMSNFELEALTTVTRKVLKEKWSIAPVRIYVQPFETSLNAPGWSISLLNVSGIERNTNTSIQTLLHLLDMETQAPAWPKNGYRDVVKVKEKAKVAEAATEEQQMDKGPRVDSIILERALRAACDAAISAEPDITKWDIEMGDGDCGEAVVGMCQGVLRRLDAGLAKEGSIFYILDQVGEAVEEIGGTLGAIISIMLASFTSSLRQAYAKNPGGFTMDATSASQAAGVALKNLQSYTSARQGGRTVMDTLIPFCESFEQDVDIQKAVEAAEAGADRTAGMKAKYGRATYVGESADHHQQETPPDPGAKAASIFLRGMLNGLLQ